MDVIVKVILMTLMVVELILLIQCIWCNHKRMKDDKKFWENMYKEQAQITEYLKLKTDECMRQLEESEQDSK